MHLCLLEGFRIVSDAQDVSKKLDALEYAKIDVFGDAVGIDTSEWMGKCPDDHCGGGLVVTKLDENEYALFCPNCGWLPQDGIDGFERLFYTIDEVAQAAGVSYRSVTTMVQNGIIGAINYGSEARAKWRIPVPVGDKFASAEGRPGWQIFWEGV